MRLHPFVSFVFVMALAGTPVPAPTMARGGAPPQRAKLALFVPGSSVAQTSGWALAKTGAVNRSAGTVTWQITASPTQMLTVTGQVTLLNLGNTPATIGNVVVKLEAKNATGNGWTTVSTDIATAALGDAATTAKVIDGTDPDADEDPDDNPWVSAQNLTENAASGRLTFTQGASTPYSLSPKKSINPFDVLDLRFTATFNNSILNLAQGRQLRAEIIVTSGNAGTGPRTLLNVDIDGSGSLSSDEARVRSKARRLGTKSLPAPTNSPSSPVTISDTLADIATNGTVTFTNAVFDIGATTGTVRVNVDGGTDGGEITNCAKLTGSGVALQACSTVAVPAAVDPCEQPGAAGCGWEDGEVASYGHNDWGNAASAAGLLIAAHFATIYGGGNLNVGIVGAAGFSLSLGDANAALAYLPDNGAPGILDGDVVDPTFTSSGAFGSNLVAAKLNIDYADAGVLTGSSGLGVGDLTICNLGSSLDGQTVSDFLASANVLLGGGASTLTPTGASTLADQINTAFVDGIPSTFAQDHLVNGACN